ncbi:MAG: UbiX family flavin prenyltransferase [Anaerolineae bacterium]
MKTFALGITGGSGAPYALRVLEGLLAAGHEVHAVVSGAGTKILALETNLRPGRSARSIEAALREHVAARLQDDAPGTLRVFDHQNVAAPIASGSFDCAGMAVVPCSTGSLGRIAAGISGNLIERAADVKLKERRPLVLVPRETPLHLGHIRLLAQAAEIGAIIMPPMPAFYHRPQTLDDIINQTVNRVLDLFDIELGRDLFNRWQGPSPTPGGRQAGQTPPTDSPGRKD